MTEKRKRGRPRKGEVVVVIQEGKPKRKRGRPHSGRITITRQIGLVAEDTWQVIRNAAEKSGFTFTYWATSALLEAANNGVSHQPPPSQQYRSARMLGKVTHEEWQTVRDAAKRAEMSFASWATGVLYHRATST